MSEETEAMPPQPPISPSDLIEIPLHRIAHSRAGDKGDRLNLSLIAYRSEHYPLLCEQVSAERVAELFAHRHPGTVQRFELPRLRALNFVIDDVLEGGVNDALNLDGHGKTHSFLLLSMIVSIPRAALEAEAGDDSVPQALQSRHPFQEGTRA